MPQNFLALRRGTCLALLVLGLCGCRYNFVPVVPKQAALDQLAVTLPVRITEATLQRGAVGLELSAQVLAPKDGYLSVVWYSQDTELGRDSVYIEAAPAGVPKRPSQVHFAWPLAQGKAAGPYRAMLLFEGNLLREVDEAALPTRP